MSFAYGMIALISLCMVGICVSMDKKRDLWLLLVFVSVAICNLGYFMLSVSKDLPAALNSNRISYLGSVFLPFFMLMMVLRFCGIRRKKSLVVLLVSIGIVMLGITTSPGVLTIYYSTVEYERIDGTSRLIREYGPFHALYYVYLAGYMLSMIGVTLYAIGKKKISSHFHTILLLCAVFCNIVIWLAEQFLPRGFEWLSVSYIITEALILVIYKSMQKKRLLDWERKTDSYAIQFLLVLFLLLFANFIRVVTKDTTPAMYVMSHMAVLLIYIGTLVSWAVSVYDRIVNKNIRRYIITLVGLMMVWMVLRTLRLTVFYYVFPIGQWCWYAYYIGMIFIPQVCLMASKYIGKPEEFRLSKKWKWMYLPSFVLLAGILTNDLHQWAFRFHLGYENGWHVYEHTYLYYAVVVWIFVCISLMIWELVKHCRIPDVNRVIWHPIAMGAVGVLYTVLYLINSDIFGFIEVTAALCFTVVAIWESCINTGLIPSNNNYDELLKYSDLGVAVVDQDFVLYYCSEDAIDLTKEEMASSIDSPVMMRDGIRVSGSKIRGGYALWQEDLSELLEVLEELSVLREELKDANAVYMQNYQMDRQIRSLVEKNRLHDQLHKQTAHQIDLLNNWLKKLKDAEEVTEKRELLRRIVVVGAYLKRRNNLILVKEQDGIIKSEELALSIGEMMKNLQLAGVSCASAVQFEKDLPADTAMKLFDFYEYVVENAFDGMRFLLARFFCRNQRFYCCIDTVCDMDLTFFEGDSIAVSVTDTDTYTLSFYVEGGEGR